MQNGYLSIIDLRGTAQLVMTNVNFTRVSATSLASGDMAAATYAHFAVIITEACIPASSTVLDDYS